MLINDFKLNALHVFQVRTLRSLGFKTRVTLSNNSQSNPKFTTDYTIDVTVYGPSRKVERQVSGIAELAADSMLLIDCEQFLAPADAPPVADAILIFHLIPKRLAPAARDGKVAISREELWHLFTAQDHYVEYYRDDGFSSGVLYQSSAFNYDKFSREFTTIIQAPKCYVSDTLNTYLSLVHTSFTDGYSTTARMKCVLSSPDGSIAAAWVEEVAPFQAVLVDFKKILMASGAKDFGSEARFYCFYGVCDHVTLMPLTFNRNERTGALAVEHSLPPIYYGADVTGPTRSRTIRTFVRSELFSRMDAVGGK